MYLIVLLVALLATIAVQKKGSCRATIPFEAVFYFIFHPFPIVLCLMFIFSGLFFFLEDEFLSISYQSYIPHAGFG